MLASDCPLDSAAHTNLRTLNKSSWLCCCCSSELSTSPKNAVKTTSGKHTTEAGPKAIPSSSNWPFLLSAWASKKNSESKSLGKPSSDDFFNSVSQSHYQVPVCLNRVNQSHFVNDYEVCRARISELMRNEGEVQMIEPRRFAPKQAEVKSSDAVPGPSSITGFDRAI